jgi:hypothetical protein
MPGGIQRKRQRAGTYGIIEQPHPETIQTYIDAPGLLPGIKIFGDTITYRVRQEGKPRPRFGRGSNGQVNYRHLYTNTSGLFTFEKMEAAWPSPDVWKGVRGTIEHVFHSEALVANGPTVERKITIPIMLMDWSIDFDLSKKIDVPKPAIGWVATGPAVFSGWPGTQPTFTEPSKSDQQQYENTSWTIDLEGIASSGQLTIDWWSSAVADTDVAEIAKLVEYAAAKGLPTGFKKRGNTIVRNSSDGGTIVMQVGLTTTKEDLENAGTYRMDDPKRLASAQAVAKVNAVPSLAAPFIDRGTTVREINDNTFLYTKQGGLRSTQDDIEFPGTFLNLDNSDLTSTGQNTKVFDTADGEPDDVDPRADSGLQVVGHRVVKENSLRSSKVTLYGKDTPQQSIEQENSYQFVDPSGLASARQDALIDATPSTSSGYVSRGLQTKLQTHDHTLTINRMGLLTEAQAREFPGTYTEDDVSDLTTRAVETVIHATITTPTPNVPAGLQRVGSRSVRVTDDLTTGKSETVYSYAKDTEKQKWEQGNSFTFTDPQGLASRGQAASVDGTPTVPTGFVSRGRRDVLITNDHTGSVTEFGLTTTTQDREYGGSSANANPLTVYEREAATVVPWTGTESALADSLLSGNQGDKTFVEAVAKLMTPAKAEQVLRFTGEDKKLHSASAHSFLDSFRGKPASGWGSGFAFGAALVKFKAPGVIVGGPGGFTSGEIVPIYRAHNVGSFALRRRYILTDPSSKYFMDKRGKVCPSTFLGHPPFTAKYEGPSPVFTYAIGPAHLCVIDHLFATDDLFFMNDGNLPIGKSFVISGNLAGSGFYAATLFDTTALLEWPDQTTFTEFLL